MTMIYRKLDETSDNVPVATVRIVGEEDIALFQLLVRRALNTWDRAPQQVKEFGDLVTEGTILQDYSGDK